MLLIKLILPVVLSFGQAAPNSKSPPAAGAPSSEKAGSEKAGSEKAGSEKAGESKLPQPVRDMEGTFAGEWISYNYEGGKVVEKTSWTDTLVCKNLRTVGGKAVVDFAAASTFDEGSITRTREWKEGYFLTNAGEIGERYVEYFETLIPLKKISETTWVYSIPMVSAEFGQFGFKNAIHGEHIVIMVDQKESGVDTRRLTRITSIVHKGDDGKETTTQFVSLKGYHKRVS